jgi:hypothetical protein
MCISIEQVDDDKDEEGKKKKKERERQRKRGKAHNIKLMPILFFSKPRINLSIYI